MHVDTLESTGMENDGLGMGQDTRPCSCWLASHVPNEY